MSAELEGKNLVAGPFLASSPTAGSMFEKVKQDPRSSVLGGSNGWIGTRELLLTERATCWDASPPPWLRSCWLVKRSSLCDAKTSTSLAPTSETSVRIAL